MQLFAAIYIGSYDVSLKVFELSPKKKIREIDDVRARIDLGRDVFQKGVIGYESVENLCEVLSEYKTIIDGYRVKNYEIYASSAVLDSKNGLLVLDQISIRTGFKVKVISNSELRFLSYKSVAGRDKFEKMIQKPTAVVDVGGSSVQLTLFDKGNLLVTQHIEIGTIRLRALLKKPGNPDKIYQRQIEEYVNKRLEMFRTLYLSKPIEYGIFMTDYGVEVIKHMDKNQSEDDCIKAERLKKYIEKLQRKNLEEITEELGIINDKDSLIIPTIVLIKSLVKMLDMSMVWFPGVMINDGIAFDYAQRNNLVKSIHNFDNDIISAAKSLSEHYKGYSPHIDALMDLSVKLFDALKKVHGLESRCRLLLMTATILHDCGKYVSISNSAQCAYRIIMSSEIIGLTHKEREIVARIVLYNSTPLEEFDEISDKIDKEDYIIIAKLSAILRVANALDQSHKQKFKNIKISLKSKELVITVESFEDISLEQALFEKETLSFEQVFSLKPVLKEKRVYDYVNKGDGGV